MAVPYPQVSSLYEALTWGFIHLWLFEPLAPSTLALRALSRTCHGMSLHRDSAIITQNCRDVPWHVRNRSTLQNDAGIEGVVASFVHLFGGTSFAHTTHKKTVVVMLLFSGILIIFAQRYLHELINNFYSFINNLLTPMKKLFSFFLLTLLFTVGYAADAGWRVSLHNNHF